MSTTLPALISGLVPDFSRRFSRPKQRGIGRKLAVALLVLIAAVYGVRLNLSALLCYLPVAFCHPVAERPSAQHVGALGGASPNSQKDADSATAALPATFELRSRAGARDTLKTSVNKLKYPGEAAYESARVSATISPSSPESLLDPHPISIPSKPLSMLASDEIPGKPQIDAMSFGLHRDDGPCVDGWRSTSCYRSIVRFAAERQENNTVVLVVATRGSYEVILNWCISMRRVDLDNYMLVALDHDAYGFFSEKGAPIVLLPRAPDEKVISKTEVWIQRTFVAHMILNEGIDVLISDADAVVMKSPFENPLSYFNDKSLDIITSPSNFPNPTKGELPEACPSPPPGKMEWRHWPCMGWTLLRSSKRMHVFFVESFLRDVIRYRDDQIGFNCAIRKAGAEWNDGSSWTSNKTVQIKTKAPKLKLMMLPSAQFVRNCTEFKEEKDRGYGIYKFNPDLVQLYHCKGRNKKANAQNNNFWFMKENWETIRVHSSSSFDFYLSSISTFAAEM